MSEWVHNFLASKCCLLMLLFFSGMAYGIDYSGNPDYLSGGQTFSVSASDDVSGCGDTVRIEVDQGCEWNAMQENTGTCGRVSVSLSGKLMDGATQACRIRLGSKGSCYGCDPGLTKGTYYIKVKQLVKWKNPETDAWQDPGFSFTKSLDLSLAAFNVEAKTTTADAAEANRVDIASNANALIKYRISSGNNTVCTVTEFGLLTPIDEGDCTVEAYYDGNPDNLEPAYGSVLIHLQWKDTDSDGKKDNVDNCPYSVNSDQADKDGDGIGDVCDEDIDGDGVNNSQDNCPEVGNAGQESTIIPGIGDACLGNADHDGDGIVDVDDNCPTTPNGPLKGQSQFWQVISSSISVAGRNQFKNTGTEDNPQWEKVASNGTHIQADYLGDGVGDACNPDIDGDGVGNSQDNCPYESNADQAPSIIPGIGQACYDPNGDQDKDGVLDSADNCPFAANPDQQDTDNNGMGDACDSDIDGDGISNDNDNCPYVSNASQTDSDGNGKGDACESVFVTNVGTNDANCGNSWASACDIQTGINRAQALGLSDVVLRAGTYHPSATIILQKGINLIGGYNGSETAGQGPNPKVNQTIIRGDNGAGEALTAAEAASPNIGVVFKALNQGTSANDVIKLSGLIVNAAKTSLDTQAALLVDNSRVLVSSGRFSANNGGASVAASVLVRNGAQLDVLGTQFKNNTASKGAAIVNDGGTVSVSDALFSDNNASTAGAAIYQQSTMATLALSRTQMTNNHATGSDSAGGAIAAVQGTVALTKGTTFSQNSAAKQGGAIVISDTAALSADQVLWDANYAAQEAGAIYFNSSAVQLVQASLFNHNQTKNNGGAISSAAGTVQLFNNTFYANKAASNQDGSSTGAAGQGGAIYIASGTASLWFNTVVLNYAQTGGGIALAANAELYGNLVAGNEAATAANASLANLATGQYNLFGAGGNSGVTGTLPSNSVTPVEALSDVVSIQLGNANGDKYSSYLKMLPIIGGGPARDVIPKADCLSQVPTDARGQERPDWKSGEGSGDASKAACDVGAYEYTVLSCEEDARRRFAQGEMFIKSCAKGLQDYELSVGSVNYGLFILLSVLGLIKLSRRR